MDKKLMDELEQYRATAALNTAGVNLLEENKRQKEWNKRLNRRLSVATTERDKAQKMAKGYESILFNLKKYLSSESESTEYVHIPHLLDYLKDLERVAKK